MYSSTMSIYLRVFKNRNYLRILQQLMAFSVVSHCIFEETCILLESPFYAEWKGIWNSLMQKSGFPKMHYVGFS